MRGEPGLECWWINVEAVRRTDSRWGVAAEHCWRKLTVTEGGQDERSGGRLGVAGLENGAGCVDCFSVVA